MMKWLMNRALFGAIKDQNIETIRIALDKGADPNAIVNGITVLQRACLAGNDLAISLLMEAGGDPYVKDKAGNYDAFDFCKAHNLVTKALHIENCYKIEQAKKTLLGF